MKDKKMVIGIGVSILAIILIFIILLLGLNNKNTYEVTFDTGSNGIKEVIEVSESETITKPVDPTREGYVFEGWYYNGEKFDFSSKITEDITLQARWTKADTKKWTVKFDSNGGNDIEDLNVEDGKTIDYIPTPKKTGYTFEGWYYNGEKFDFDTVITKDITLQAKWEEKEQQVSGTTTTEKYSVKFDSNGGSAVKTQSITKNSTATKPSDPIRAGYTFVGWYNGNILYNFSNKVTKNITLTAKWEKVIAKYTVTFDTDGGNNVASQTVEEGKTAIKPSDPIKTGYTFIGWYYGNTKFDFTTTVSSNLTLTAKYTKDVVVSYVIEDVPNSLVNQAKLYILKDGVKVRGTIDVTNASGKNVRKTVETTGLDIVKGTYTYSNPKVLD